MLRRRAHLKRSELLAHTQNTASQYNLPSPGNLTTQRNRIDTANTSRTQPSAAVSN